MLACQVSAISTLTPSPHPALHPHPHPHPRPHPAPHPAPYPAPLFCPCPCPSPSHSHSHPPTLALALTPALTLTLTLAIRTDGRGATGSACAQRSARSHSASCIPRMQLLRRRDLLAGMWIGPAPHLLQQLSRLLAVMCLPSCVQPCHILTGVLEGSQTACALIVAARAYPG